MFAAMDDIAREAAKAKREFSAEIEKSTDDDQKAAKEEKCAPEFANWVHPGILLQATDKLFPPQDGC